MLVRVTAWLSSPVASRDEVHLDSVLESVHPDVRGRKITRSCRDLVTPRMPVVLLTHAGASAYMCSSWILPDAAHGGREHLVRRKDAVDVDGRSAAWTPGSGPERQYMLPVVTTETPTASWLLVGQRRGVLQLLRRVRQIGTHRRHGYGMVIRWEAERVEGDPVETLAAAGRARRHLPAAWVSWSDHRDEGAVRPPYWHPGRHAERVRAGARVQLAEGLIAQARTRC